MSLPPLAQARTLDSLEGVGLTLPARQIPFLTDEPKIPEYFCYPNPQTAGRLATKGVSGLGFDVDDTLARTKAVAECLERLCLFNPSIDFAEPAAASEVASTVDPALFLTYSEQQLEAPAEAVRQARECRYRWYPALDRTTGKRRFLPAQMVFLTALDGEYPLRREHLSTGGALGSAGTGRALASGIFESVERDAGVAAYLKKSPLRRIVNLPPAAGELTSYLERYRLTPRVFDLASDLGIPAVLAITIDESGLGPAVGTGLRASPSYAEAITGAMLESIQARRGARLIEPPVRLPDATEIRSVEDRFYFWNSTERIGDLRFWLESKNQVSFGDLPASSLTLEEVIGIFRARQFHVFAADVTLPEIRRQGFEVYKVVIPELHPLFLDERAKALYSIHHGEIADDPSLPPHPIT